MNKLLQQLQARAAELGATVEHEPQPDGRATCYQVIAPAGRVWKAGPTCIRVEWFARTELKPEIERALDLMTEGLIDDDYQNPAEQTND